MNLTEMIEEGIEKTNGSQQQLADYLGISSDYVGHAKHGRRGLPLEACGKLAKIIDMSEWTVTCASALVTEKDESKREYFRPFVEGGRKAAMWIAGLLIASTMTLAPTDAGADDTLNVSRVAGNPVLARVSEGSVVHPTNYAQ